MLPACALAVDTSAKRIVAMRRISILAPLVLTLCATHHLCAQGYPPDEAARQMKLAQDLQAQLVASEPMIAQPVCIEFDDRGRLWVMQYLQYPNPAGLKRP